MLHRAPRRPAADNGHQLNARAEHQRQASSDRLETTGQLRCTRRILTRFGQPGPSGVWNIASPPAPRYSAAPPAPSFASFVHAAVQRQQGEDAGVKEGEAEDFRRPVLQKGAPRSRQLARSPRLSRVPVGRWRSISRQTAVTADTATARCPCADGDQRQRPASWQPVAAEARPVR